MAILLFATGTVITRNTKAKNSLEGHPTQATVATVTTRRVTANSAGDNPDKVTTARPEAAHEAAGTNDEYARFYEEYKYTERANYELATKALEAFEKKDYLHAERLYSAAFKRDPYGEMTAQHKCLLQAAIFLQNQTPESYQKFQTNLVAMASDIEAAINEHGTNGHSAYYNSRAVLGELRKHLGKIVDAVQPSQRDFIRGISEQVVELMQRAERP